MVRFYLGDLAWISVILLAKDPQLNIFGCIRETIVEDGLLGFKLWQLNRGEQAIEQCYVQQEVGIRFNLPTDRHIITIISQHIYNNRPNMDNVQFQHIPPEINT